MKFLHRWFSSLYQVSRHVDPFSLQFRLTVGIAAVATMGLGSVAAWTSWKMQQQLVSTHKQSIQYIASRFPRDVKVYAKSNQYSLEQGLKMAIAAISTDNILVWIEQADGTIIGQPTPLPGEADLNFATVVAQLPPANNSEILQIDNYYLTWCSGSLVIDGNKIGTFYITKDITADRNMLTAMIRNIAAANLLAIAFIILAIAIYVRRSLQPVRQISQHAKAISASDLGKARVELSAAPTEVRELAQTLDMMLSRLSESWERQRQFVSNVSHELRTPLTIVQGYLQSLLRRGTNLTEPQREALEIASGEADRTIQLLQNLLDLARVDNGQMHFQIEPLNLHNLVCEVAMMAEQCSNRTISICAPHVPIEVKADRDRLKQVLLNLIDNAVKYSDCNTPIELKLERSSEQVSIQVCDRGRGIALQHQARLFERFYRVDEARCRTTGGTGLGLSIVQSLVEGMGGRVTVASKLGEGSTFTVILPVYPPQTPVSSN